MSIVTKTGDKGETSLMYGRRVSKADPRVDAYGCVDELNAALGLARSIGGDKFVSEQILAAQKDLILVMGELATAREDLDRYVKDGFHLTSASMVDRLTAEIVDLEQDNFARTTCRRAERRVAMLIVDEKDFNPEILRYLNRLSDFCWLLGRYVDKGEKALR